MSRRAILYSDSVEDEDKVEVSVDLIDTGLYLGNLACAKEISTLRSLSISHILTIDLVPLPHSLLDGASVTFKFIKLADVPNEDLITHLPDALEFISEAIDNTGVVLVHCYFGVSRSAAVTVAYLMARHKIGFDEAYALVKSKRRFIGPNPGFVAQLKLFGIMHCTLDMDNRTFKQFRLKLAGQQLKQVKILPQMFRDLIKPDPGLARERPDPVVYRCRRCRRVVAAQANIIPHVPRHIREQMARNGGHAPPATAQGLRPGDTAPVLFEKLRCLASSMLNGTYNAEPVEGPSHTDEYQEQDLVDAAIPARVPPDCCRLMWFVEPMEWMRGVARNQHGKLHCPKCQSKLGSYSWVNGCRCPCGQKVAPAFYLVPSKVEWSNFVQNIQYTV